MWICGSVDLWSWMTDEGNSTRWLTCFRVLTLSWIGLGKPTRVSISLQNNKHHYSRLKERSAWRIFHYVRWNTYFPRVNPMNLFLLVSRKCSMSFSLYTHTHTHTHTDGLQSDFGFMWEHLLPQSCIWTSKLKQPIFRGCAHVCAHAHTNKHSTRH